MIVLKWASLSLPPTYRLISPIPINFPPPNLTSIILIPINLIRHNHHPEQKHGAHDLEREGGFPRLADTVGLEPGQGILALAGAGADEVAVAADAVPGAVQLDRGLDEARQPQHEQDRRPQHHDPRQQQPLRDQPQHREDEQQRQP